MSGTENNASAAKRSGKRWWFTWALVGVFGGVAVNLFAPRIYQASTNILIIPQRVPLTFVQPNVTAALSERLDMMSQIILSRTELERIIQEFHLYESERRVMIMEDLVAKMRRDISLTIPRRRTGDDQELRSFSVAFRHNAARTAMRVTERLASLFVRENLEDRQLLADQTDQFLKAEIEDLRGRLLGSDLKLRAARQRGLTLSDLTAEHDVLVATFKQLLVHSESSQLATRVERRQIGEQFRIIDGARLPERPISPRTWPYLIIGALSGLAAGLVLRLIASAWRRRRAAVPAPA